MITRTPWSLSHINQSFVKDVIKYCYSCIVYHIKLLWVVVEDIFLVFVYLFVCMCDSPLSCIRQLSLTLDTRRQDPFHGYIVIGNRSQMWTVQWAIYTLSWFINRVTQPWWMCATSLNPIQRTVPQCLIQS